MVIEAEFYPNGQFHQRQGYAHSQDHYSTNGYGHKKDHYSEDGYHESGSSMQMMRPHVFTQPAKQFAVGHEDYAYQESGYGGKHQSYHRHDSDGYSSGMPQSGRIHSFSGHGTHGYPKPSSGMNMGNESHHGSYMQMRPGKFESGSYDYHGQGRNRCPPNYEQQHMGHKSWFAKGAEPEWASNEAEPEWTSKGL